jgi:hypothetical protein
VERDIAMLTSAPTITEGRGFPSCGFYISEKRARNYRSTNRQDPVEERLLTEPVIIELEEGGGSGEGTEPVVQIVMVFHKFVEVKRAEPFSSGSVSLQHGFMVGGQKTLKMFRPQLIVPGILWCYPYDPSGGGNGVYISCVPFSEAKTVLRKMLDQIANL